jgi:hypothetical protein
MRFRRGLLGLVWFAAGLMAASGSAVAQQVPAVQKALDYLRNAARGSGVGEVGLATLALIKAEVPLNDPGIVAGIKTIESRFQASSYVPERTSGTDIYAAAVIILALANHDPSVHRAQIASVADFLIGRQNANGSWDYHGRDQGDTSISQYAVLGLWEAENAGARVSPGVWDRAAAWYISTQSPEGSWTYHRDSPSGETVSMSAAGVGSLLICQRQLAAYKQLVMAQNPYLMPVMTEAQKMRYVVETKNDRIISAANAGMSWISRNFSPTNSTVFGGSPYYGLYGIERIGALAGRSNLGGVDWYEVGGRFIVSSQQAGGNWSAAHGEVPNTAWAVLFLTKSTKKSVERIRIRRLGAGELFGGKGLPKDLSTISEAGGRLIARPMDGAVEGMLTVLEDPRAMNADSALAGLLARYQNGGPRALAPFRDRFRKLLNDTDPGVRRVAAWALGRIGDLANVPPLIDALHDPDEVVVNEVKSSLQLLSRKIEGFGPPASPTPEQRETAVKAWKSWYEAVRPFRSDPGEGAPAKAVGTTGRKAS